MPIYVDPRTGETYSNVPEEDEERARTEFGLVPQADWEQRQADKAVDTKGPAGLVLEGAERGVGHIVDAPHDIAARLIGDKGADAGLVEETPRTTGASLFPEAFSEEARRRTELHPVYEGVGTGAAIAPVAAGVAALTGGLGLGALGPAVAAATAGTVTEAAAQEYDDAWLEKRPMELKNVAGYTAMFGLGNVLLGGLGKVGKKILGGFGGDAAVDALEGAAQGETKASSALGGRNLVAEATAKAEKAAGSNGGVARSVGAASAEEMSEPFDAAIGQMSDRDAVVLARDADDHLQLISRHSADDWSRVHKGLSDSLGNQLKYRDVQIAMDALTPKQLAAQTTWTREAIDHALGVAEQIRAGGPSGLDYGNAGKQVASDIERYSRLIMDEADPAKRFQLFDTFKKTTDKRIMQIAGDFRGDATARASLLEQMTDVFGSQDVRGLIRDGLENPKYWGHAGTLQKALNAPWHDMLKHWGKVTEKLLEHTGETQFGVMGAGRKPMEGTAERLMAVFQKDPRLLSEFGKHLSGVFDGYQRLIEAREAHGIVEKEGLPELAGAIRNLMEDWNLATTVGVARNKLAHAARNPKKLEKLLQLAEKTPFGIGSAIGAARHVSELAGDLRIQKGTPLFEVWDRGLKRYALHPELADPSIHANYSPWMQETLRARGAPIPPPPTPGAGGLFGGKASPKGPVAPAAAPAAGGGLGAAAAAAAKEHAGKVAGVGLLGASAALEDKDNPNGAAAAGVGGLGLLLGKGGGRLLKEEASELLGMPLHTFADKDSWGHILARRWLKSDAPLTVQAFEHQGAKPELVNGLWTKPEVTPPMPALREWVAEAAQRTGASEDQVLRTALSEASGYKPREAGAAPRAPRKPKGPTPPASAVPDRSGIEGEFDDMGDQLLTPPDMKDALKEARRAVGKEGQAAFKAYQSQAGFKMNEAMRTGDFSSWGAERAGDVESYLQSAIDSGATAPGFVVRGVELSKDEVERLTAAKLLTAKAFVSTSPNAGIAKRFAGTAKRGDQGFRKTIGDVPVLFEIEQATGVPLSAGEVTLRPGTQFKVLGHRVERVGTKAEPKILHVFRVRESGYAPGAKTEGLIAGGLIGLGGVAAASNAHAAEPPSLVEPPDPGPDPQQGPVGVYRDAMRTVAQGGEALIRQKASSALRFTPPKGRSALRAFTGRRGLDAAVDAARDALQQLQSDPEALIERLAGSTGDLATTHPGVYMALTEKAHSLVAYLSAEAPQRTGQTLLDPEGMAPSLDRSLEFAFKTVGTLMPEQAMNDVARLDAPPEEVAAFQQNWPELWEPYRAELLGQVQRRHEAGRPVDSEKLRQLDSLLQMDGQLDPSASSAVAQQILAAAEQQPPAPSGGGGSGGGAQLSGAASSSFRTRLEGAQMENSHV